MNLTKQSLCLRENSMIEQFIRERMYLKGVSPNTVRWYRDSFRAFQGATDSKSAIVQRIEELTQRGVKPVSINTYLRCITPTSDGSTKSTRLS